MSDTGAQIRVGSSAECMDADVSNAESPVDMCSWIQQPEDSDDRCIILIQLFGGYLVSERLHVQTKIGSVAFKNIPKVPDRDKLIPFLLKFATRNNEIGI